MRPRKGIDTSQGGGQGLVRQRENLYRLSLDGSAVVYNRIRPLVRCPRLACAVVCPYLRFDVGSYPGPLIRELTRVALREC